MTTNPTEPTAFGSHIRYPDTHPDMYCAGTEWVLVTSVLNMPPGEPIYQRAWVSNNGRIMHGHDDGSDRMPPGWELIRDAAESENRT